MSVLQFTRLVKIPNTTIRRGIKLIKEGNLIKVEGGKGRPSMLSVYQYKLLCGIILWKDLENNGMSPN